MIQAKCPVCASRIVFAAGPKIWQQQKCPACGLVSEVVWLYPVELDVLDEQEIPRRPAMEEDNQSLAV
jgi:ribosomal protein L37AE/L43A